MMSLFGVGINKHKKELKKEVENIDKDIRDILELLKEFRYPYDRDPKKIEKSIKLIEKILKEIEEHKKSLHKLYGSKPDNFPELKTVETYLNICLNTLKAIEKRRDAAIHDSSLEMIEHYWQKHRIKFK